jgi:hypothetical protein
MMGTTCFALSGSPLAVLQERIAAELAAEAILCACPHPVTADMLELPRRILGCDGCVRNLVEAADAEQAPMCACCGTGVATRTSCWAVGSVLVVARLCDPCGTAVNVPVSPN